MGLGLDSPRLDHDSRRWLLLLRPLEEKECPFHDLGFHDDFSRCLFPGKFSSHLLLST